VVQVEDRRRRSAPATYTFRGRLASLYVACCDKPRNLDSLAGTVDWSRDEIAEKLDDLCHRGLMMRDGALYLSLALPSSQGR
jgi:hypothetical protein